MISFNKRLKIRASVNVDSGYVSEENIKRMKNVFSYVENSPYKILVNGVYPMFKEFVAKGSYLSRPGYKFRLWFSNVEDAKQFSNQVQGYLEIPPVLPKP